MVHASFVPGSWWDNLFLDHTEESQLIFFNARPSMEEFWNAGEGH
jgi:hypothetical protein